MKISLRTQILAGFVARHRVTLTHDRHVMVLPVLRTDEFTRLRAAWERRGYTVTSEIELVEPEAA